MKIFLLSYRPISPPAYLLYPLTPHSSFKIDMLKDNNCHSNNVSSLAHWKATLSIQFLRFFTVILQSSIYFTALTLSWFKPLLAPLWIIVIALKLIINFPHHYHSVFHTTARIISKMYYLIVSYPLDYLVRFYQDKFNLITSCLNSIIFFIKLVILSVFLCSLILRA